jgi:N-acetylneuraminate synthase
VETKNKTWLADATAGGGCTVIAEIAQAHDGSLGMAHAYVDAAAAAGADAVKFQTHIAEAESTPSEPWRAKFSHQDETRLDYWRRMEFTADQWHELKRHADDAGIMFLSSPFSLQAVDLLKAVGVAGWKVASGEITNTPMLEAMAATRQPVLLSTGMSPFTEIDEAVALFRRHAAPLAIFQCTTQYPSPPQAIGLNVLDELRARYDCAVGLSDHSGTIYPALAAATLGVDVIEVHLTMSREMFGPDVTASVTSEELAALTRGVRFIEQMRVSPVDKSQIAASAEPLRKIFLKSIVPTRDLAKGTVLDDTNITTKKPGTGIPASAFNTVVGRQLARDVKKDVPLLNDDLKV